MQWIKCSDRLPEDGQHVLVFHEYDCQSEIPISSAIFINQSNKYNEKYTWDVAHFCECDYFHSVTHWMPLPDAPKDNE